MQEYIEARSDDNDCFSFTDFTKHFKIEHYSSELIGMLRRQVTNKRINLANELTRHRYSFKELKNVFKRH